MHLNFKMVKQKKEKEMKIGGGLYVVLVWLAIVGLQSIGSVYQYLSDSLSDSMVILFLLTNIIFGGLAIAVFVLILKKKKMASPLMIILVICNFLVGSIAYFILEDYLSLVISFMVATLFVVYFLISKRVKETLVK